MLKNPPPSAGQQVLVRRRPFVVQDVQRSQLGLDPVRSTAIHHQHRVTLSCLEEDALGEQLEVIWEIEPGATVVEGTGSLPEPKAFDDPRRLDAFLDAVRWGAISSSEERVLQAPFRSGITIEDYQLDPIARALAMPRVNLLIADDVGLGKTIEAGLVAEELILRQRVRNILIVCPSSIQIQWQEQMRDKFGLQFEIVNSEYVRNLRKTRGLHVNPWNQFPRLITSIDYIKREQPMRLIRELLPSDGQPTYPKTFDLLIVDEAHNVAPPSGGNYAMDSQRTTAIRTLAPHYEFKLFLTATPHNGYQESFSALLELLDNQRFARGIQPDERQLRTIMVRRMKSEIVDEHGKRRFKERHVVPIEVDYSPVEREAYQKLERYRKLREHAVKDDVGRTATTFVLKLLKKRLFSSPSAFVATLEQHEKTLRGLRGGNAFRPSAKSLQRSFDEYEDEWADDEEFEDELEDAVGSASRLFDTMSEEEKKLLRDLHDWGRTAERRPDTKCQALLDWLEKNIRPKGKWSDRRVIIFTQYRATQKWLLGILAAQGFASEGRLLTIYGGMQLEEREEIKAAFQASPKDSEVRILLATDSASEGIDLQNHCHQVIHYEIPWNPNVLEQRNGRVDRHGQKHDVLAYHFVGKQLRDREDIVTARSGDLEADLEFLMVAARKVDQISKDLRGKVNPVIASQIEERMLGRRTSLDTRKAEEEAGSIKKQLSFERNLREETARLAAQLVESRRELHVYPESVKAVVDIGLELAGKRPLEETMLEGVWPDPAGKRKSCPVFHVPQLDGAWRNCSQGLQHPHTKRIRPITFDDSIVDGRDDVVLVHLNHRMVQMCQRLLRAEVWSQGDTKRINRVAARLVPNSATDVPVAVAFGRIVVLGQDNRSLHEEVISAGGAITAGRLRRIDRVGELNELLEKALPTATTSAVCKHFRSDWTKIHDPLMAALQARMETRTKNLASTLQKRADREASDIEQVLRQLESSIRSEFDRPTVVQQTFWKDVEAEEFERNKDSLKRRLEQIPLEITRERERVFRHYAEPTARLFPIAVMLLVPNA